MFALVAVVAVLFSLAAVVVFDRPGVQRSLFRLSNLVGPTAQSLLAGGGLTVCTEAMGTPGNPICFHGGRMPLPTLVVALGVGLLGDRYLPVAFLKTMLLLLPVLLAMWLVCQRLPEDPWRRWGVGALLLVPFGMTAFLADVVNLQVEEGYAYAALALATATVLFRGPRKGWLRRDGIGEAAVLGMAVATLYLAKSSMAGAALVLTLGYVLRVRPARSKVLAVVLAAAAPVGWAMHQHHATGRYSAGTSLDGFNLRKGNHAGFLEQYPPAVGDTLDREDAKLNAGQEFRSEWSFNDFHKRAAVAYLETHPAETARGAGRKLTVLLLSMRKVGSRESHGVMGWVEGLGLLGFRLLLWGAIGWSVFELVRRGGACGWEAGVFLLVVVACTLPYVVGFAYTRHGSVLIYPAALLCCRMLTGCDEGDRDGG